MLEDMRIFDFTYPFQNKRYAVAVYDWAQGFSGRGEIVVFDGMSRMVGRAFIDERKLLAASALALIRPRTIRIPLHDEVIEVTAGDAVALLRQLLRDEVENVIVTCGPARFNS